MLQIREDKEIRGRKDKGESTGDSEQTRELLHEGSTTLYGGDPGF